VFDLTNLKGEKRRNVGKLDNKLKNPEIFSSMVKFFKKCVLEELLVAKIFK
jgi:hypothetical protein